MPQLHSFYVFHLLYSNDFAFSLWYPSVLSPANFFFFLESSAASRSDTHEHAERTLRQEKSYCILLSAVHMPTASLLGGKERRTLICPWCYPKKREHPLLELPLGLLAACAGELSAVCMVSTFGIVWIDQPGMVASPARGQLNPFASENSVSPAVPSCVSPLILHTQAGLVLTHGVPPAFREGVHLYSQSPSGQPRVYRVTQLRTDGVHCRESAGAGPV